MPTENVSLPCGSWVFSTESNCSYAGDRFWFGDDYQSIESSVNSILGGPPIAVIGIGTVVLPVKRSPSASDPNPHGTLHLTNVLHTPGAAVNVISHSSLADFDVTSRFGANPITTVAHLETGEPIAFFSSETEDSTEVLNLLQLSPYPVGPLVASARCEPNAAVMYAVKWPVAERQRCLGKLNEGSAGPADASSPTGLNEVEGIWLKKHYGVEYRFLLIHGLDVHKEDHREQGRAILRALMACEQAGPSHINQDSKSREQTSVAVPPASEVNQCVVKPSGEQHLWREKHMRRNWNSNVADHYFAKEELEYIINEWGNSSAFIYSIGLNFYHAEDCKKAQRLAKSFNKHYQDSEYIDHQVHDRLFSHHQLYYINRACGNSALFMAEMDLSIYSKADRREAESIAKINCEDVPDVEAESTTILVTALWNVGKGRSGPNKLAEHFLSCDERDFINRAYGDALTFMICFGLKYRKGADCRKASRIASFLMRQPIEPGEGGDDDYDWTDEEDISSDEDAV